MTEVVVGGTRYRLVAERRDRQWLAHAVRADTGERFGVDCSGSTEAEAIDRLTHWLEWQREFARA